MQDLEKRKRLGNLRTLTLTNDLIDFASNDYLGLARSKKLRTDILNEWQGRNDVWNGSTGSRLLTGNSEYAQNLENNIAAFHGYPAGLLFNCGYMANVGLISAVSTNQDTIFYDAHIHASTHDGIKISRSNALPFRHNNPEHLEQRLKNAQNYGKRFVCIESIYSTDGSIAPLQEICQLGQKYNAHLIVDEAHAIGVFGPQGRGFVAQHNLETKVFAQINTFGKALGTFGAIVLGSYELKQMLINFANSFVYTTALPLLSLFAITCSYNQFPKLEYERQQIQKWISLFRKAGLNNSISPIQSIRIQGNEKVQLTVEQLQFAGFDVRALKSPTVRRGHEALRICLHAFNKETDVRNLLEELCKRI